MKSRPPLVLAFLAFFLVCGLACGAGEAKTYAPTAAHDLVEAACRQAKMESKAVFLKSGFPECGWCRVFDRYHDAEEVRAILGKYYVIAAIDTRYMPDGKAVFGQFAKPGAPAWVIIAPDRQVLADSYAPDNVGYPFKPDETAHYLAALKKATPSIGDEELQILSQQIGRAVSKK